MKKTISFLIIAAAVAAQATTDIVPNALDAGNLGRLANPFPSIYGSQIYQSGQKVADTNYVVSATNNVAIAATNLVTAATNDLAQATTNRIATYGGSGPVTNAQPQIRAGSSLAAPAAYSDRLEATNGSGLKLVGGGVTNDITSGGSVYSGGVFGGGFNLAWLLTSKYVTNNTSFFQTFSNGVSIDAAHALWLSNATPSTIAVFGPGGSVTSGVAGANLTFTGGVLSASTPDQTNTDLSLNLIDGMRRAATNFATVGHAPRILWLGDSLGQDSYNSIKHRIIDTSADGYARGSTKIGDLDWNPIVSGGGVPGRETEFDIWDQPQGLFFMAQGGVATNLSYTTTGGYVTGDQAMFWYAIASTNATAVTIEKSTDSVNWTPVVVVNQTTAVAGVTRGLNCTNVSFTRGNYKLRITATTGRAVWMDLALNDTTSTQPRLYAMASGGLTIQGRLNMGTNTWRLLLTNLAPDLIFYQQYKTWDASQNWEALRYLFATYAPQASIVLPSTHAVDPANDLINTPAFTMVTNTYTVALTNVYCFIDMFSPMPWTNAVQRGFNSDTIHWYSTAGYSWSGDRVAKAINLDGLIGLHNNALTPSNVITQSWAGARITTTTNITANSGGMPATLGGVYGAESSYGGLIFGADPTALFHTAIYGNTTDTYVSAFTTLHLNVGIDPTLGVDVTSANAYFRQYVKLKSQSNLPAVTGTDVAIVNSNKVPYLVTATSTNNLLASTNTTVTEGNLSLSDVTTWNATTSHHGFAPKGDGNANHYLDGNLGWSAPPGGFFLATDSPNIYTNLFNDYFHAASPTDHKFQLGGSLIDYMSTGNYWSIGLGFTLGDGTYYFLANGTLVAKSLTLTDPLNLSVLTATTLFPTNVYPQLINTGGVFYANSTGKLSSTNDNAVLGITNILARYITTPTNPYYGGTIISFTNKVSLTNMAGNMTVSGLANFNPTNDNKFELLCLANGSDRTITVPAEWRVMPYGGTTIYITNGGMTYVTFHMQVGQFTNALTGNAY